MLIIKSVKIAGISDLIAKLLLHQFELARPLLIFGVAPMVLKFPKLVVIKLLELVLPFWKYIIMC